MTKTETRLALFEAMYNLALDCRKQITEGRVYIARTEERGGHVPDWEYELQDTLALKLEAYWG